MNEAQTTHPIFSSDPEKHYVSTVPIAHRKRLGQYFTPYRIAACMAQWIVGNSSCKTILDPAVGLGVFFRVILEHQKKQYELTGYDTDAVILNKVKPLLTGIESPSTESDCSLGTPYR